MSPIPLLVFNCHFATDHLHTVQTLIFYHCHFQLSSLCNWPSTGVCPLYNIPSLGVKGTSAVLWSSANFCSISQNMHYKVPVASQHWKTNQVVWTWKDDWPPRELLLTKDLLPERVTIQLCKAMLLPTVHSHEVRNAACGTYRQALKYHTVICTGHTIILTVHFISFICFFYEGGCR